MSRNDLPLHLLPAKLREIADYCGPDTALKLLAAYPGIHCVVPLPPPPPEHKLVGVLGYEGACRFCEAYGGDILQVPKADRALRLLRDARIRSERAAGARLDTLALRYGLTERQIGNILGSADDPARQLDLFSSPD